MGQLIYYSDSKYQEVSNANQATHVLLSKAEWNDLVKNWDKGTHDKDMALEEVNSIKEKMNALIQQLNEEKAINKKQAQLNENLLRINKERSNAQRNLQPKKEHTGYIVTQSQEKTFRYVVKKEPELFNRGEMKTYNGWETTLQSPYSVDFIEEHARIQIDGDLTPSDNHWLIGELGIDAYWNTQLCEILQSEEYKEKNVAFQMYLRANFKIGYWEVIYSHTKALGLVPKNMKNT